MPPDRPPRRSPPFPNPGYVPGTQLHTMQPNRKEAHRTFAGVAGNNDSTNYLQQVVRHIRKYFGNESVEVNWIKKFKHLNLAEHVQTRKVCVMLFCFFKIEQAWKRFPGVLRGIWFNLWCTCFTLETFGCMKTLNFLSTSFSLSGWWVTKIQNEILKILITVQVYWKFQSPSIPIY